MSREGRDRMTDMFVAVGDALRRSIVPTVALAMDHDPRVDLPRPSYLPEVPPLPKDAERARMDALISKGRRR
jgi:hypothetical protein